MKKNVASQVMGAQLISKTDGSAITTGTTTIYICGDAGTQAAGSVGAGACTHEGNGYWTYLPAQAETNYDQIGATFVNTSACNVTIQYYTTFPQGGDNFARLGAPAGASVSADVAAIKVDTAAILLDTGTDGVVLPALERQSFENGQAQGGAVGNITLRAAASAVNDIFIGQKISIYSGTGAGQTRGVSNYNGTSKVATVARNWTTAPDATSMYRVEFDFGPKVNNSLEVTASEVTGAVGSVTAGVTVTTNSDKTGYSLTVTPPTAIENADTLLNRDMATGTDSGSPTVRTVRQALRFLRNKWSISAGTLTVTKENDTTASWTATVTTDAAAVPIIGNDPAS